jgi:O-antigen ligase
MTVLFSLVAGIGSSTRNPRPIEQAIEGRLYIWTIAADRLREYVVAGQGPGSFARVFPAWESAARREGRVEDGKSEFVATTQDHAHNEYLELLIEQGIAGLVSFVGILIVFLGYSARRAGMSAVVAASSAGVVALAVVALTDFPFHRPAELFLFWTLMAVGFLSMNARVARKPVSAALARAGRGTR